MKVREAVDGDEDDVAAVLRVDHHAQSDHQGEHERWRRLSGQRVQVLAEVLSAHEASLSCSDANLTSLTVPWRRKVSGAIHVLRLHAGYRCRHAGVCCTEDWAIPVEAPIYRRLAQALESSALRPEHAGATYFEPAHGLPADEPVVTGRVGRDCAFFEPGRGRLCAIHEQLGHDHLPSACQHFPRVVTIDPRGVFVSLSHVCPTAGRLLREPMSRHSTWSTTALS